MTLFFLKKNCTTAHSPCDSTLLAFILSSALFSDEAATCSSLKIMPARMSLQFLCFNNAHTSLNGFPFLHYRPAFFLSILFTTLYSSLFFFFFYHYSSSAATNIDDKIKQKKKSETQDNNYTYYNKTINHTTITPLLVVPDQVNHHTIL